jgi:hypothetical protein
VTITNDFGDVNWLIAWNRLGTVASLIPTVSTKIPRRVLASNAMP